MSDRRGFTVEAAFGFVFGLFVAWTGYSYLAAAFGVLNDDPFWFWAGLASSIGNALGGALLYNRQWGGRRDQ